MNIDGHEPANELTAVDAAFASVEVAEHDEDILVLSEAPDPDAILPMWEPTGNATVDAALDELRAIADADLADHAQVYDRVQTSLRGTLDGLVTEGESG